VLCFADYFFLFWACQCFKQGAVLPTIILPSIFQTLLLKNVSQTNFFVQNIDLSKNSSTKHNNIWSK